MHGIYFASLRTFLYHPLRNGHGNICVAQNHICKAFCNLQMESVMSNWEWLMRPPAAGSSPFLCAGSGKDSSLQVRRRKQCLVFSSTASSITSRKITPRFTSPALISLRSSVWITFLTSRHLHLPDLPAPPNNVPKIKLVIWPLKLVPLDSPFLVQNIHDSS